MVGGIVIEVIVLNEKIWVNAQERQSKDTCAIYVEKNDTSLQIKSGDSIWWQGGYAMWTPKEVVDSGIGKDDIRIPRIGFSGVAHPN